MRRHRETLVIVLTLAATLPLIGCGRFEGGRPTEGGTRSVETSPAARAFGPVYDVHNLDDPLVAKTVEWDAIDRFELKTAFDLTASKTTSAEIRGYLVDWVVPLSNGGQSILELIVMKDGSVSRPGSWRPSAAFGREAEARLGPEPAAEALARQSALQAGQEAAESKNARLASVAPIVYGYLLKLHRADGSSTDLWVDPGVNPGAFHYGEGLGRTR